MFRMIPSSSVQNSKDYYTTADYYTEGQELEGIWRGEGAKLLGLSGVVAKKDWDQLCDNINPGTGHRLTIRTKADRRVGYDFNFHVPKSVSLLYSLTQDERLLDAFRSSVHETMQEMEAEMKVRVRKDGRNEDSVSGNLVWGEFIHTTSRPVAGVPDPHLHAHCFVFNASHDPKENRWKAGQFGELKRDAPYFEAVFHTKFSERLRDMGLNIERTGIDAVTGRRQAGWDLAGVSRDTILKFSRRTAQIEAEARKKGIIDPEQKAKLGAKTRATKDKRFSTKELKELWTSWLTKDERGTIERLHDRIGGDPVRNMPGAAEIATGLAVDHCFERKSVVPERMLLAESLKRGIGMSSRAAVEEAFQRQDLISAERNGRRVVTTRGVLAEEKKLVEFARSGRGTRDKLADGPHSFKTVKLGTEQRNAVMHVLHSRDTVVLIRGGAGTGKTSMMREAVDAIEAKGTKVFTFAPSADASRNTLRSKGFPDANTVANLLIDEKSHEKMRGQVIWIDEAGLLGTVTMSKVFELAKNIDARVVLSGDRRQHGSVERGSALRLLEVEAGIRPAEIKEIQRQEAVAYKQAIGCLSEGRTADGFEALYKLEWIKEVPLADLDQALAVEYADTIADGKEVLAVCPTHAGGDRLTHAIRNELKQRNVVSTDERRFQVLDSVDMTVAERGDSVNYLPGFVAEYHQNAKGHRKGDRVTFGEQGINFAQSERFQTYRKKQIDIAAGDVIRVTKNGTTADRKHKIYNGSQYKVREFDAAGNLVLDNGWVVGKEFGHFTHGWVLTSHASQGKSVHTVLVAQPADTFAAASQQQFYVSASRGEKRLVVFTDSKESLFEAVQHKDERLSATEMVQGISFDEQQDIIRRQSMIEDVYRLRETMVERQQKELTYER